MDKKNSLLVVDDDVSNLIELTQILQTEYKIFTAKDGSSALERAKKSLPDLILLDIIMPDMNGFDVISKMKKDNATKNIPVIFITGISENDNESEGLSIGAVDYIRKPFDATIVTLRVRHQIQMVNLRRELEHAARSSEMASRAKSLFLANMSHEIRTPMNAILGVTEILIEHETLPMEIEEGLNRIYSSCDLLLGIINDVLDFSKIEAGKLDIVSSHYKIASLINDSVQLNMMRISSKPIEFDLQIDENIPANLFGDELRIKQILNNLLSNAFKYTDAGKVTLTVGFETSQEKDDIILVLSVKDTGCGMTKDQLNIMFEEYARFNRENNINIEGTGLGLAITQQLITLMKGEIQVESEPDKGSLFTARLPQKKINNEILGKEITASLQQFKVNYLLQRKREHITRDLMPYGRVLVVDDVETNIFVASGLMKLYKLQIDTAMSGQEAIDKIKNGNVYDVVFMDHMMPEMDGIETVKNLRDLNYLAPIVALTANAVAGQADIFMSCGFNDFISKPIDIRQLNSILNKFIRDKQPPEVIEELQRQNAEKINAEKFAVKPPVDPLLLVSFVSDANKTIKWLDENKPQKAASGFEYGFKDDKILQEFIVIVHGIKSSLWNIDETELAEHASRLEIRGREISIALKQNDETYVSQNVEFIVKAVPDFIDKLRALLEKIELRDKDKDDQINCDMNIDDLRGILTAIQQRAADYDRKGVLNSIKEIKNCSKKTKEALDIIKGLVTHSEFEEAAKTAADFISGLK